MDPLEESLRFPCTCGESLEVPREMVGRTVNCPWCTGEIVVPSAGGVAAELPALPEEPPFNCPECASPSMEPRCLTCGVVAHSIEGYALLPACLEQEILPPWTADWILRKCAWLLGRVGPQELLSIRTALPARDGFLRADRMDEDTFAEAVYLMRRHAGLHHAELGICEVDRLDDRGLAALEREGWQDTSRLRFYPPAGEGDKARLIVDDPPYNDPPLLLAAVAGELGRFYAHLRLRLPVWPLDGEDLKDLLSVFLGFGALTCYAAFRSVRNRKGWIVGSQGSLLQVDLAFSLALLGALRNESLEEVAAILDTNPRTYLQMAGEFFSARPDLVSRIREGRLPT